MKVLLLIYSIVIIYPVLNQKLPVNQGICGRITVKHGNYMPSPGRPPMMGKPVSREIFIYELTNRENVTGSGTLFTDVKTKFIKSLKSDVNGNYVVALKPGNYSVFVKEGNQMYANNFDGLGNINPVKVKKDSLSKADIIISLNAVY